MPAIPDSGRLLRRGGQIRTGDSLTPSRPDGGSRQTCRGVASEDLGDEPPCAVVTPYGCPIKMPKRASRHWLVVAMELVVLAEEQPGLADSLMEVAIKDEYRLV